MKVDIDCIYSYENAKQLLENADTKEVIYFILHLQLLGKLYRDDRKSYDLACKIAECFGFINFLSKKHTYKELEDFYELSRPIKIDKQIDLLNCLSILKEEPEKVQKDVQENKKPLIEVSIPCNCIITNEVKQMKDMIMTANENELY